VSLFRAGWPHTHAQILRHIRKSTLQLRVECATDGLNVESTGKPNLKHLEEGIFRGREGGTAQDFDKVSKVVAAATM
jgi:hypothetical protein